MLNILKNQNIVNKLNIAENVEMKTFGQRLRAYRKKKKVTGGHFEKVGISRSKLSNLEADRWSPTDEVLTQIASIPELEIDLSTLKAWRAMSGLTDEEVKIVAEYAELLRGEE
jgi:transcriptional regulator with XRE-family HTH domain